MCVWRTEVFTTMVNESTLWLDALRSGITMPGSVVQSAGWAVSTLLQWRQRSLLLACSALVGNPRFVDNTVAVEQSMKYAEKRRMQPTGVLNAARGRADI